MMRSVRLLALAGLLGLTLSACAPAAEGPTSVTSSTPTPVKPVDLDEMRTECALLAVRDLSIEDQIRSVLMVHVAGRDRQVSTSVLASTRPGGVIAMGGNIGDTPENTADVFAGLTAPIGGLELPLILAVDQEGGYVNRIPQDSLPAGAALQGEPAEVVEQVFAERAELVRASGLNTNFGIVADYTANTQSFIYSRVLGISPDAAAVQVRAAVNGERGIVLSTLKHFPGHGATALDSHFSLPTVTTDLPTWRAGEAVPFEAGIAAGAELVMMGHLVFSAVDPLPASQSARWVSVLRDDLGFEGLIVTDDMRMLEDSGVADFADVSVNSIRALQAGVSMLVFVGPSAPDEVIAFVDALVTAISGAVTSGQLSADTVAEAAARVYGVRRELVNPDPRSWCTLVAGEYSISESPQVLQE